MMTALRFMHVFLLLPLDLPLARPSVLTSPSIAIPSHDLEEHDRGNERLRVCAPDALTPAQIEP